MVFFAFSIVCGFLTLPAAAVLRSDGFADVTHKQSLDVFTRQVVPSSQADIFRSGGTSFSEIVIYSRKVYLSGLIARNSSGTVAEQTTEILDTVDRLLIIAGTNKSRILTANVYLSNISSFLEFNTAWRKWLDVKNRPVRATVATGLVLGFKVEIQVSAAMPDRSGVVRTAAAAPAVGPYSQGVVTRDGTLYVSGSLGLLPGSGEMAGPDIAAQARQALKNVGETVKAAGGSIGDIVKTTIYLADINDFPAFNEIYKEFVRGVEILPARSTVAVRALPRNARIEVEAVAYIP